MKCSRPTGLLACASMIASCASSPHLSAAAPQIEMPPEVTRPCTLARLAEGPRLADLEKTYAARGEAIVACDAARSLAVAIHRAEHRLEAEQAAARVARARPWWAFWR